MKKCYQNIYMYSNFLINRSAVADSGMLHKAKPADWIHTDINFMLETLLINELVWFTVFY